MENIPAVIYIKDENDRHIYGNPAAFKSVGMKPDDFIGSTTRGFFPSGVAGRLIELDRQVRNGEIPRIVKEWENTENGGTRWRRDIKFPIQLKSGKMLLGGIAIDITEIKLSEQKLRNALNEIEQLKQKLEQENIYLREELEINYRHREIVGESTAIQKILHQAEKVANEETTILILGETGTGKELLARAIHRLSPRKDGHMVKVNCAALPANLVESELFGREKGAFTGAMARQVGRFESADGSTIFLDEIGDLPLELQTKLLRVLQEGQFERLGSIKTIAVDVRVIAATNLDLRKAVQERRFRRDLYYRLNVFPITVPPLRERRDDIPLLTWAFVKHFSESMGKQISTINRKSMDRLKANSWPGNVRELKNVIERSMILSTGPVLHIGEIESDATVEPLNLTLDELERAHILNVLENTGWRVRGDSGAARILGLKPTTLEARMRKLGIQRGK
jgi:PAS domain S-box-containing protein